MMEFKTDRFAFIRARAGGFARYARKPLRRRKRNQRTFGQRGDAIRALCFSLVFGARAQYHRQRRFERSFRGDCLHCNDEGYQNQGIFHGFVPSVGFGDFFRAESCAPSANVRLTSAPSDRNKATSSIRRTFSPSKTSPVCNSLIPAGDCTSAARARPRCSTPMNRRLATGASCGEAPASRNGSGKDACAERTVFSEGRGSAARVPIKRSVSSSERRFA